MSADLAAALRRRKPERRTARLAPRPPRAWTDLGAAPVAMILDTGVYIHNAAGRLPAGLRALIDRSLLFHCSVALAELAVGVAAADPRLPGWAAIRDHYVNLFSRIPDTRLLTPDPQIFMEAGLLAGTLARLQGFQPHQRAACLNDALIRLVAIKAGLPVLTANGADFDLISQLAPEGAIIAYRPD